MLFMTAFCHCSPWHTNVSIHLLSPPSPWTDPPLILVLMLTYFLCSLLYASHDLHPVDRHAKTDSQGEPLQLVGSAQSSSGEVGECCHIQAGQRRKLGSLWHKVAGSGDQCVCQMLYSKSSGKRDAFMANGAHACSVALCLWLLRPHPWAPRVRGSGSVVSELTSAWAKTHQQRLHKGTQRGMARKAQWAINMPKCRTLIQEAASLSVALSGASSSSSAALTFWRKCIF